MSSSGEYSTLTEVNFHSLRAQQLDALTRAEEGVTEWEGYLTGYKALSDRLLTLTDHTQHHVMAPLGSHCLVPATLVHTNEILVLLGNEWFAERSAKQASEIAGRRAAQCQDMLNKFKAQKELCNSWLKHSQEIMDENVVEINEQVTEDQYLKDKEVHRENVKKYRQKLRKQKEEKEDFTALLDRLKEEETNNCELIEDDDLEALPEVGENKKISWDNAERYKPQVIKVTHTKMKSVKTARLKFTDEKDDSKKSVNDITSPSDIYTTFASYLKPKQPKSILKCSKSSESTPTSEGKKGLRFTDPSDPEIITNSFDLEANSFYKELNSETEDNNFDLDAALNTLDTATAASAFSHKVVEKTGESHPAELSPDTSLAVSKQITEKNVTDIQPEPPRPISKFKASRMKK